MYFCI